MWLVKNTVWLEECNPILSPVEEDQLDKYFGSLLDSIATCSDAHDAQTLLYELGDFQGALISAHFLYNVELYPRCKELIGKFDRWDLSNIRHEFFNQIKNRQFCVNHDVVKLQEEVMFVDDTAALYICNQWKIKIQIQKFPDVIILDADTIKSWLPPHEKKYISDSEKQLIQKRMSDYFDSNGVVYGWI